MSSREPGDGCRPLRVALAQVDTTVGDFEGNAQTILAFAERAHAAGAQLVAFPELCLTGYPPEDMLLRPSFVRESRRVLAELARRLPPVVAVVGFVDSEHDIYNAAAVLQGGEVRAVARKSLLPNYGVFDELRYFEAGEHLLVLALGPYRVGINICEDIWYPDGPARLQSLLGGAQVIVNLSSSPYYMGKIQSRERMLATRALDYRVVLAYVNMVGGQDELVFDGTSCVIDEDGVAVARAPSFEEALLVADVDPEAVLHRRLHDPRRRQQRLRLRLEGGAEDVRVVPVELPPHAAGKPPERSVAPFLQPEAEVYRALVTGLRDYVRKNGFSDVVVAMSGGIDSSLVAVIAVDALGPEHVTGVGMPSRFSSQSSVTDAREVAARLGIRWEVVPIEPVYAAYLEVLEPLFAGRPFDVTEENLQARVRGTMLMALSNKFGWMVLSAGNKSELSVGYCTLYGSDMTGGFAVIKDVPKTWVYRLARWRNARGERPVIPDAVLVKEPSAELRPGQKDTDSLPPYEVLDPIVNAYVQEDWDPSRLVAMGYDPATVERVAAMIVRSEYKRRQAPPGVKITPRAFGRDWRFPITNRYIERLERPGRREPGLS